MAGKFDFDSTADEVLAGQNLTGKRVLVTGVSAGLGVETARSLAARGASVIGTARDLAKAERAVAPVRDAAASGGGNVEVLELDLADLASVRAAADRIVAAGDPLDIVIANAGVMATPFERTVDGHELQFGTNVLGHYALIARIAPMIRDGGRIVTLSSAGHRYADVDLDDPDFERTPYDPWIAYGRSKTGDALLAVAFDAALRDRGIRAASIHPGGIETELGRHLGNDGVQARLDAINVELAKAGKPLMRLKSVSQGAATTVWAAVTAPADEVGGRYCEDCHVAEVVEEAPSMENTFGGVRAYAVDPQRAAALVRLCERLTGTLLATR
jgi:NAD(P)-dependent dehydrogenase (short-subunit alcohol dehydrogenase family)